MAFSELKSLTDIFDDNLFRIPDFQRGYAWEDDQLNDFWNDILNLEDNSEHYTGALIVTRVPDKEIQSLDKWKDDARLMSLGVSAYYVIDGQQRLTTSIILLNELLQTLEDDESINLKSKKQWQELFLFYSYNSIYRSYKLGYEKEDPSCEFFKVHILDQNTSRKDQCTETVYTINLLKAKKFFAQKVKSLSKKDKEKIFKRLVTNFKFNFYELDDSLDMYISFEMMNNRGKNLSHMELLKNRLIYLTTALKEDDDVIRRLRQDINESWKTIYTVLGQDKEGELYDDDFLYAHWVMYFFYNKGNDCADFLLKKEFTLSQIRKKHLQLRQIKDYIDSLAASVSKWVYLTYVSYSDYSEQVKKSLNKMNQVGWRSFVPLTMAVLLRETDESKIVEYLNACERFNFLVFSLTMRNSGKNQTLFYQMANDYYQGKISLDDVIEDINNETDECTDLDSFKYNISKRECGFYDWGALKYFLYEYELYLQEQAQGESKVSWEQVDNLDLGNTVEHIFPQNPNDPYWKEMFGDLSRTQKKAYMNSLGNLLLLSRSKNSALQNHDFNFKKNMGNGRGYYNGSYSEIEISRKRKWTPETILRRGMEMLAFMEERWDISFREWGINKADLLLQKK